MKLLIVPDIHNRVQWAENILAVYPGHVAVFLGDYFDSYHDTPSVARQTAEWLRYSLHQPGRIHLMGNHDLPYRWKHMNCPGYHSTKGIEARKVLSQDDWARVGLYHIITTRQPARPLVLSHAGFTLANLFGVDDARDVAPGGRLEFLRSRSQQDYLREICKNGEAALRAAHEQRGHFWFNQGTRMGHRNVGGPFWLDRHAMNHQLPGIDQIVGHTQVQTPQCQYVPNKAHPTSKVWFIDCGGACAATVDTQIVEDGGMKIETIPVRGTPQLPT